MLMTREEKTLLFEKLTVIEEGIREISASRNLWRKRAMFMTAVALVEAVIIVLWVKGVWP